MNPIDFNIGLLQFLDASPTPFHATTEMGKMLVRRGFKKLDEKAHWHLEKNRGYWVTRNGSSLVAFLTGDGDFSTQGFRMVGAHTDSPCLKVKPEPEVRKHHCLQLGVEVYGGALLAPWFDRDLSIAGRVAWLDDGQLYTHLLNMKRPIATIPSLAIHLDRDQNYKRSINAQTDIPPLLAMLPCGDEKTDTLKQMLAEEMQNSGLTIKPESIMDFELFLYDTQPAANIGWKKDFIASARLDNLLSCYTGINALMEAKSSPYPALVVCNDHEEVGSMTATGAQGPFLKQVLKRITGSNDVYIRSLQNSLMISADNAHAAHPNFPDKHDRQHAPVINQGPVIKINANQRYATNSESSAVFRRLCQEENVPVQVFNARCDMGCGSTIGPITAAELGILTLDVGLPTYGMHSIRELAGAEDAAMLDKVLKRFFNSSVDMLHTSEYIT